MDYGVMGLLSAIDAVRVAIALVCLSIAAYTDYRTRMASDWLWRVMGFTGVFLMFFDISAMGGPGGDGGDMAPVHYVGIVPVFVAVLDISFDRPPLYSRENGFYLPGLVLLAVGFFSLLFFLLSKPPLWLIFYFISPVAMVYFYYILYLVWIIQGGADAKALMAMSVLFPRYPAFWSPLVPGPFPEAEMSYAYPFSLLVLTNAAILAAVFYPAVLFFINARRGDFCFPAMLLGYRKSTSEPLGFNWPMQKIDGGAGAGSGEGENGEGAGKVRFVYSLKTLEGEKEWENLRETGLEKAWVRPKIPLLVFILAGFVFSLVVGNPLGAAIGWLIAGLF